MSNQRSSNGKGLSTRKHPERITKRRRLLIESLETRYVLSAELLVNALGSDAVPTMSALPYQAPATSSSPSELNAVSFGTTQNEMQRVSLPVATGGTWTLSFDGQTTAAIAYGASAAVVQSALEGLSNLEPGDIGVSSLGSGIYELTFSGAKAYQDLPQVTADGSLLTGVAAIVDSITNGHAGDNEVQRFEIYNGYYWSDYQIYSGYGYLPLGTFRLSYNGNQTYPLLASNTSQYQVKAELESLPGIGVGNVTVTQEEIYSTDYYGGGAYPIGYRWIATFAGALAGKNVGQIGVSYDYSNDYPTVTASTSIEGGGQSANEVQSIAFGARTGGTFTLSFKGKTTAALAFNATASQVQAALSALSTIGAGNVSVTGNGSTQQPYKVQFQGLLGNTDLPQLVVNSASLTGGGLISVSTTHEGSFAKDAASNATEGGAAGFFRVYRNGSTSNPLTVTYTIAPASTATNSNDYSYLSGSVTIPAGQSSALINLNAVDDYWVETTESLTLNLTQDSSANGTYTIISGAGTATASIVDNDELNTVSFGLTQNEVQRVILPVATGGTWTLSFDGQTTAAMAYGASAAVVQSSLEALSNLELGDVSVSGQGTSSSPYVLTFSGAKAYQDLPQVTADGSLLTGIAATVDLLANGRPGDNEVQKFEIVNGYYLSDIQAYSGYGYLPYGYFRLYYNGNQTDLLSASSATVNQVKSAIESLPGIGAGNVTVTQESIYSSDYYGGGVNLIGYRWIVTFTNALANTNIGQISVNYDYAYDYPTVTATTAVEGKNLGANEVQSVALGSRTGGTFTLSFKGKTTSALAFNATAAQVQAALSALSTIGAGNVSVTGNGSTQQPYQVQFQGLLGNTDVPLLVANSANLLGGGLISVSTTQEGSLAKDAANNATEGGTAGFFRVYRSGSTHNPLTVAYSIDPSSTATNSNDYSYLSGSITIPAGQTSALINLNAIDDYWVEGTESLTLNLAQDNSANRTYTIIGGTETATASIVDNDELNTVSFGLTQNEVQRVVLPVATGGTWKLSFDGQKTAAIAYGASAAVVQSALEALPNLDIGDITVSGQGTSSSPYVLTFGGAKAYQNVPQVLADGTLLTGIAATVDSITNGKPGDNEVQKFEIYNGYYIPELQAYSGYGYQPYSSFRLSYNGSQTPSLSAAYSTEYQVKSALESLPSIGAGNVTVTKESIYSSDYYGGGSNLIGYRWTVTFTGALAATNVGQIGIDYDYSYDYPMVTATTSVEGSNLGANEVQRIVIGTRTSGTFTLSYDGQTTSALRYNATAAQVQAALSALSKIGSGNVSVTGAGTVQLPYQVQFQGMLGNTDVPLLMVNSANLVGGALISVSTPQTGSFSLGATKDTAEGGAAGYLRVYRSGSTNNPLTVAYAIDPSSTATNSKDYGFLSGSITIPAGQTNALISLRAVDDYLVEGTETLTLNLTQPGSTNTTYAIVDGTGTASASIVDNDNWTASIQVIDSQASEQGTDVAVFRISRSGETDFSRPLSVAVSAAGTAVMNGDYTLSSTTIPANQSYVDVTLTPINDAVREITESAVLSLVSNGYYWINSEAASATATIADNDNWNVSIEAIDALAAEQNRDPAVFRISRTGETDLSKPLVVSYALSGTALPGSDYNGAASGTVTIPANATYVDYTITPANDALLEPSESVVMVLAANAQYSVDAALGSATATIADNDNWTISVEAIDALASEQGQDPAVFRITRTGETDLSKPLAVTYSLSGTASVGLDYSGVASGTITIPVNATYVDYIVRPTNDALRESTESVVLTLTSGAQYSVNPVLVSATASIADNDNWTVSVEAIDAQAAEQGQDPAVFRITRTGETDLSKPLVVSYSTSGTALAGGDYGVNAQFSVTIPVNATYFDLVLTPMNDALRESTESAVVTLTASAQYAINPTLSSAVATIVDNDNWTVSVEAIVAEASEQAEDPAVFRFTRTGETDLSKPLTVSFAMSGTAVPRYDHTGTAQGSVVIPANASYADYTLTPYNDALRELTETAVVTLNTSTQYSVNNALGSATALITDNDNWTVSVEAIDAEASEQAEDPAVFRFTRTGETDLSKPLTVSFAMSGTAVPRYDHTGTEQGSVVIPANASYVDYTLTPYNDALRELTETAVVTLNTSTQYSVNNALGSATALITDNDNWTVSVEAIDAEASEQAEDPAVFRFTRTGETDLSKPLTVSFAMSGTAVPWSDHTGTAQGSVIIPANATYVDYTLTPINDALRELTETAVVTLNTNTQYSISNALGLATALITDNDNWTVSVETIDAEASEQAEDPAVFRFTRTGETDLSKPLTVSVAMSGTANPGTDYSGFLQGTAIIPANESYIDYSIKPFNDALREPTETLMVTLVTRSQYSINTSLSSSAATIADNDNWTVSIEAIDAQASEQGEAPAVFRFTRNGETDLSKPLMVSIAMSGSALPWVDYPGPMQRYVTIPVNESSVDYSIAPINDKLIESTEEMVVTLLSTPQYLLDALSTTATATIVDNDHLWIATDTFIVDQPEMTEDSVDFRWTDGQVETSYEVQRLDDSSNWITIAVLAADTTTYSDSGLSEGGQYTYRLMATNDVGHTSVSDPVTSWTLPKPPTEITLTPVNGGQLDISWTDQSRNETAYFVEQLYEGSSSWTRLTDHLPVNSSGYSASGPFKGNHTYSFRVGTFIQSRNRLVFSEPTSVTTPAFPDQPSGLTASLDGDGITLQWQDVQNETGYIIERRAANETIWTELASVTADVISFTDSGFNQQNEYLYRITAKNAVGRSAPSSATYWGSGPDSDHDGLKDLEEELLGTDPHNFDSDGDLLNDGFEIRGRMDPANSDQDGNGVRDDKDDFDNDGLSNLREAAFDTAPYNADTDGDQVSDGTEIKQGSNPKSAEDKGRIPDEDQIAAIKLTVGDPSGSHSERYEFIVGPIHHQAPEFGVVSTDEYIFETGNSYTGQIYHRGTDPDNIWTKAGANYDWIASIELGDGENQLIIVDDRQNPDSEPNYPDQILRTHIWDVLGDPFLADGKTVKLHIPKVDLDIIDREENEVADDQELGPGGIVNLNKDDDDKDGILDYQDPHIDGGDDDLLPLKLHDFVPLGLDEFDGGIKLTFDKTKVRVWKDRNKDNEVVSGVTELRPSSEYTLYLEGMAASVGFSDVEIKASYAPRNLPAYVTKQGSKAEDVVRVTVASVDSAIDAITEEWEISPGAIVWKNNDFSKKIKDSNQPEDGIDKYIADYHAESLGYGDLVDPSYLDQFTPAKVSLAPWMVGRYEVEFDFDPNAVKLWTLDVWDGFETATGGWYRIPAATRISPLGDMLKYWVEGIGNSTELADRAIKVTAIPADTRWSSPSDEAKFTIFETNIGVDGNRDQAIDLENSFDHQLTFWYNNDQEGKYPIWYSTDWYYQETEQLADVIDITEPDNEDLIINSTSDLEDFAPFDLYVDPLFLLGANDRVTRQERQFSVEHQLLLKEATVSKLNVFERTNEDTRLMAYLDDDAASSDQAYSEFFKFKRAQVTNAPSEIRIDHFGTNGFLFEASGVSFRNAAFLDKPKLVYRTKITFLNGRTTEIDREVELELRDFQAFFSTYDIKDLGEYQRSNLEFQHYPDAHQDYLSAMRDRPFLGGSESIVLLHGWNNSEKDKESAARTAFKRLYWQGFRGEMIAFNWPTFYDAEGTRIGDFRNFSFNASEFQAWRSGQSLMHLLQKTSVRGSTHLLAHSMGNIVAAEALRQHSQTSSKPLVESYVAMQAAISSGAYGNTGTGAFKLNFKGTSLPHAYSKSQQDLYGHWYSGVASSTIPDLPLMSGAEHAASNWINIYNPSDFATNDAWRLNNLGKLTLAQETPLAPLVGGPALLPLLLPISATYGPTQLMPPEDIWGYRYIVEPIALMSGQVLANKYYRVPYIVDAGIIQAVDRQFWVELNPMDNPYEILAFTSVANAEAVGNVNLSSTVFFSRNIDITSFVKNTVERSNAKVTDRSTHSFEFLHDYYVTMPIWNSIKNETNFAKTW